MMDRKLLSNKITLVIFYLALALLINWKLDIFFLIGGIVGIWGLEVLDRIAWAYTTHPENTSSVFFRKELQKFNSRIFTNHWEEYSSSSEHTFKSIFFQTALLLLTSYVILTGQNGFFIGVLLVLNLIMLLEQLTEFKKQGKLLNWSYLTNLTLGREESLLYLAGVILVFVFMTIQL